MKYILTLFFTCCLNGIIVYAQYDSGTVIYSQTGSCNNTKISKNYVVADFDGDNYKDIILIKMSAENSAHQLCWYKGDSSENFSPQNNLLEVEEAYKENEIFYKDMNKDDIKDIVFQNSNTSFMVLLNDGTGNISAQINNEIMINDLYKATLKEVGDIDEDGDLDLLFIGETRSTSLGIYRENCLLAYNNGSGNFSFYNYLNDDETSIVTLIEATDFDGDGDVDIAYSGNQNIQRAGGFGPAYYTNSYINIYENLGNSGFAFKASLVMPVVDNSEPAFTHIKAQDINSDGTDELLIEYAIWDECQDQLHKHNCVYFYQFHILDYNAQNGEFIALEEYNSWLHGYTMNELLYSSAEFYDDAFVIQFGHQNTDNNLDVLSLNVPQGKLQWYLGDGNGNYSNTQFVNFNSQYSNLRPALKVADIDNDTDLDVFVLLNDDTSSTLTVFKNLALFPVCAPLLDLADTALTNGVYQAGTTLISAGNVVSGNNNVVLKAGTNITLQNGFQVPLNSTVNIYIDACN